MSPATSPALSLALPERLTHAEAPGCLTQLTLALAEGQGISRADASRLAEFDSSALAVLLALRREALARGRDFAIDGLPPRLRELASVYGVLELLPG